MTDMHNFIYFLQEDVLNSIRSSKPTVKQENIRKFERMAEEHGTHSIITEQPRMAEPGSLVLLNFANDLCL